jgi:hypothetical protein
MNNANGKRRLDWQGIFRGVQNKGSAHAPSGFAQGRANPGLQAKQDCEAQQVLPAAPKEGFTAARKMPGNQVSAPENASSS